MKSLLIFTIIFIFIILIELYLIHLYVNKNHEKDQKEEDLLRVDIPDENVFVCQEINKRVEKLKTMSYEEWIKYNQDNVLVTFKPDKTKHPNSPDEKLYIFIYEQSENKRKFTLRVTYLTEFIDMNENEFIPYVKETSAYFSDHEISSGLGKYIYDLKEWGNGGNCSRYSYLWVDPFNDDSPIIKTAISKRYSKVENGQTINGIVSIGYVSHDLLNISQFYYEIVQNYFLIMVFSLIYFICVFSYYINPNNLYKVIVLLLILNIYVVSSFLTKDIVSNIHTEESKTAQLNSSILGISFLVAAIIFIIQSLQKSTLKVKSTLYNETAFLFCCSLITQMLAMFKITSFMKENDVKVHRIQNQMFFNISIIINIFIFINYFSFIYYNHFK
jgi:hypothetical protein